MKRALKWIGIGLGGLVGLLLLVAAVLYALGSNRLYKTYDLQVETVAVPSDEESIARGRHLAAAVTLCQGCHGEQLEGQVIDEAPGIYTLSASNLTSGQGGVGAAYSDTDYVRAIRHGVNPESRGLLLMHSDFYHNLSQEDLGAIIAFVKSVPPADNELPDTNVEPMGRVLTALGMFDSEAYPIIPAEVIDHGAPFVQAPAQVETAEYGRYLMSITLCAMCHGSDMRGAPPIEEGMPAGPNIAVRAAPGGWSEEQFVDTMRTGVTPSGRSLNTEWMPWDIFGEITDEELGAIWQYMQSLPPGGGE